MPCGRIGSTELLLIALLLVVLFGAGRLPELGRGLGLGIRRFKKSIHEEDSPPADKDDKDERKQP